jgi:outer membrane protein assembly factor BamB
MECLAVRLRVKLAEAPSREGGFVRPSNGRGIIPQHIVARSLTTYVLLLCLTLGVCPQTSFASQREPERKPLPAPLLPAEQAWTVSLPAAPAAQGALDESRAYIPLQTGELLAIDRETGATVWSITLATSWAPVVRDGVLYAAGNGELQAVGASTGEVTWRSPLDAELMATPTLQDDALVLLVKPDELRALRKADGSEIWRRAIGAQLSSPTLAADSSGVVVVSGSSVRRFALSDGRAQWTRELSGVLGRPTLSGDRIFVGSTDNYLYALNADNGRLAWPKWRAGGDVVGAAADDRFVFVASLDNLLRGLRRGSGNQVWKRELETRTIAPPSTFGGLVLVTGNSPTLSTFDAATGEPIGSFSVAADLQGVPLVDMSLDPFSVAVIAVTRDARAIGLRPTGMMFRELPLTPIQTLPGRPLNREPLAIPRAHPSVPEPETSR